MTSFRHNLNWLLLVLFIIGSVLLAWGLYAQWRSILERHEIRQTSQITTIGSAIRAVLHSQETVLGLIGSQLIVHWQMGQIEAVERTFGSMLDTNRTAAGYALLDPAGNPVVVRWREEQAAVAAQTARPADSATCQAARTSHTMIVGPAYQAESSGRWLVPVCKSTHSASGKVTGFVSAALAMGGADSSFAVQAALGRSNVVQVVRGSDLSRCCGQARSTCPRATWRSRSRAQHTTRPSLRPSG